METNKNSFNVVAVRNDVVAQISAIINSEFVSLPSNYRESVFFAIEKMSGLTDIDKVPISSISKALITIISENLDYKKNHCYFFVQGDKNSPTGKSLRFGLQYQGLIHIARTTCNVNKVIPVLVYSDDVFKTKYDEGELSIVEHTPTFNGSIIGGYCIIKYNDSSKNIKYFTREELDKRRNCSMAKNGQFWKWEREMYEKTLINACLKRIIESEGTSNAIEMLYTDNNEYAAVTPEDKKEALREKRASKIQDAEIMEETSIETQTPEMP